MFKIVKNVFHSGFPDGACLKYDKADVWFMLTERGDAAILHIKAKGRNGKLKTREASKEIIRFIAELNRYKMIIAPTGKRSVVNLCKKIGFKSAGFKDGFLIMVREL